MGAFTDFRTRQDIVLAGVVGTSKFENKVSNMTLDVRSMFPKTPKQKGLIQVQRDLSDQVRALAEQVAPATVAAFERHLLPVAERALDEWPILSGLSKSLLSLEWTTSPDGMEYGATLANKAPYAWYITTPTSGGRKSVVRELVFTPGQHAAELIAEELGRQLADGTP